MANLNVVLTEAGLTPNDLVKLTIYLTDPRSDRDRARRRPLTYRTPMLSHDNRHQQSCAQSIVQMLYSH